MSSTRRAGSRSRAPRLSLPTVYGFAASVAPWSWYLVRDITGWADALALLLPPAATIAVASLGVIAWTLRSWAALLPLLSTALFGVVTVVGPGLANPTAAPTDSVRMMAANLESYWFSDNDFDWFLETHPVELLVASEMAIPHRDRLRERFEYHVDDVIEEQRFRSEPDDADPSYKKYGFPSIGVYSSHPLTPLDDVTGIEFGMPGLRVRVDLPTGPVVLYALHVPKPHLGDGQYQVGFGQHRAFADALAAGIAAETLPVVVLGDLNMTDRGGSYRALTSAGLRDGMLTERARPTSVKGFWYDLLLLRIDHLLVSDGMCTREPRYDEIRFADHLVISAAVGPCPGDLPDGTG